jgi:hypothetical protein
MTHHVTGSLSTRCADGLARGGQLGLVGGAGDAEVDQVGVVVLVEVVLVEQDVGRLDITVHQPGLVRGMQRSGDPLDDRRGPRGKPTGQRWFGPRVRVT